MKILELRFKNLNSLYGEWHIDFTDPEYAYNGIFALTGPTGAGKSTILDAICLALYGSTPRLGRITQSNNDIMSRQTGECFAEVVFASQAGSYRCNWAQHRSRRKAEGELQSPKHEIAEADGEQKVLETKLTSVLTAVEEKTGMDFDRFTRSILLAQGGFDTFLKATVEQKSKILEQITGTKIYSDISIGVHERLRQEKSILENLNSETRGILVFTAEEELAIEEEITEAQHREKTLGTTVSDLTKAITWLQGIAGLQEELKALAEDQISLEREKLTFAPRCTLLESATKAATLEGSYATLTEMRNQQKLETSQLSAQESTLPTLVTEAHEGSEALILAEIETQIRKTEQIEAAPILKQVRSLDQKIAQLTVSMTESTEAIAKDVASIGTNKTKREAEEKKESDAVKKLTAIETYCAEHAPDRALITELTGLVAQLQALEAKQEEVGKKIEEEKKAAKALKVTEKALTTCKGKRVVLQEKYDAVTTSLNATQEALALLLGEKPLSAYRTEKEYLLREKEYLARIAALEEHRNHLIDGQACPLCGSVEHPFALGNIPTPDTTDEKILSLTTIITDAENLETKIQELQKGEREATVALSGQDKLEAEALHTQSSALLAYATASKAVKEATQTYVALKKGIVDSLFSYGIEEVPDDLDLLQASLRARKDAWLAKETEKQSLEGSITAIKGELQRLDGVIAIYETALQDKQEILKTLGKSFADVKIERHSLFTEKDADNEEVNLAKAVQKAETKEKEAGKASSVLSEKVVATKTKIEALQSSLSNRKPLLKTKESLFLEELASVGFSDENQFSEARLPLAERNRLGLDAKALDDRQTSLTTTMHDRSTRLASEQAKQMTDKPLVELQPQLEEHEKELKEVRDAVAEYRAKRKGNSEAKQRIASKLEGIERQKREVAKWEKLHSLIGSADGKKFRNFAQGLTFELMVGHANRQLSKMSERYLLIRDEDQPLELNVIDNYQAGEIRSTKNLSGGESFIVSLTLALGLSKMASRKVRVDSLFLDEGFGTLDEESLETALKTLSSLQQDGKLIGVISHVSAMQEMISTQITVTPQSGGRSVLSGPGCSKVVVEK